MLIGQAVPVGNKVAVEFPDGMYVRIESKRLLEEIRTVMRPVGVQSTELLGIVGSRKVIQARMTRETELRMRFNDDSLVYVGFARKKNVTSAEGQQTIQEWMRLNFNLGDFIIQNEI
jgi:hypothetical protein